MNLTAISTSALDTQGHHDVTFDEAEVAAYVKHMRHLNRLLHITKTASPEKYAVISAHITTVRPQFLSGVSR